MRIKPIIRYFLFANFLCLTFSLFAQKPFAIKGRVIDASTKEGVPFATVFAKINKASTSTDVDGFFKLSSTAKINEIQISSIGYKTLVFDVKTKDSVLIRLDSDVSNLQEVVVKPPKYRNKNNPTVELIKRVVDNRKKNRVDGFDSYQEEQYEKILLGFTDLSDKVKNNKMLRTWKTFTSNTDTTLLKGSGITPVFLQESVQDFYSQRKPKRSKIWVRATQKIKFPIMDDKGVEKYLRYLYQEADIYDDYVELLTDHFISPIADNAPIFYRYYPADTVELSGSKIVRLQFFPRNKTDMLLQGELFIALDSTYPVTRITYSVNPNINLNWVRKLEMDQIFKKLPSGKWVLAEENYTLDFGATQKGLGVFAKRYVSHINQQMGVKLRDSIFQKNYELRTLAPSAENKDTTFWKGSRHTNLTATEANTYKAMDSVKNTLLFKRVVKTIYIIATGHFKPYPGYEIGRVNTFYSFNPIEGTRLRFGARTNPDFSKRVNFEGYGAYGFKDEKWKYGVAANITLSKDRAYNRFPYNMLRINYSQDLLTPGVLIVGTFAPTSIASSFTRGTNDRFFFQKKFVAQYEREYNNHFSFIAGFEYKDLSSLGSLKFIPTDDKLKDVNNVISAKPFLQLRYAPGEEFYESTVGWRQRVRFRSVTQLQYSRGIKGLAGSQYNFDELYASYYKFSNTPPMGYNYCFIEGGAILGKVPYPLLTVHRGNQTFGYRFMAYNLMNFMEFVSDKYASINVEQNFYGFFTNKIPLVRRLKLREYATFKMLYGTVSNQNKPTAGSGLYELPKYADGTPLTYTLDKKPYIEASVGLGNIFKIIRIDLVRRFTYLEHPQTAKYGVRIAAQLQF